MRSWVARLLQFTVKQKVSQVVGAIIGTIQVVLLFGGILTRLKTAVVFAEQRKIKKQKADTCRLFCLAIRAILNLAWWF